MSAWIHTEHDLFPGETNCTSEVLQPCVSAGQYARHPSLSESGGRDQHSDFSFAADYSSSSVTCTSFISVISVMTIARVPLRSNTIPFARTYLPKKGFSFSR